MTTGKSPVKNAVWIIACRLIQSVLNVFMTMLTARFLGPGEFGLLNYAASLGAFAAPLMMLGFNTTLVQELVAEPENQGCTLGTALVLNLLSSVVSGVGIGCFAVLANPGEKTTWAVCILYSLSLPFQALEMVQYWFQAELKAKYLSLAMLVSYVLVSVYRFFLLATGKGILWFAAAQMLESFLVSGGLLAAYYRLGGQKLGFSAGRERKLLARSRYYIVSSLMTVVFAQTDRIMLKAMLGAEMTGYYSAAAHCAGMTNFVFSAIVNSAKPVVWRVRKESRTLFQEYMTILYAIVLYLALAQSGAIGFLAEWIIGILYGAAYDPAVPILRILVWYTVFSYLGMTRTVWILAEEKHGLVWEVSLLGAAMNVLLNLGMIPLWGGAGAALASLATQFFVNVGIGFLLPGLKENNRLLVKCLSPNDLLGILRGLRERWRERK